MILFFLRVSIILFSYINYSYAKDNNFTDYPLSFIVESCQITKQRAFPENIEQEKFYENKKKYYTCMNFIMSLSTTLNRRCISSKKKEISTENSMTFADLSKVNSTSELINEIIEYSNKYPHFLNQIGWLHASKAISQKWPCKQNL